MAAGMKPQVENREEPVVQVAHCSTAPANLDMEVDCKYVLDVGVVEEQGAANNMEEGAFQADFALHSKEVVLAAVRRNLEQSRWEQDDSKKNLGHVKRVVLEQMLLQTDMCGQVYYRS